MVLEGQWGRAVAIAVYGCGPSLHSTYHALPIPKLFYPNYRLQFGGGGPMAESPTTPGRIEIV